MPAKARRVLVAGIAVSSIFGLLTVLALGREIDRSPTGQPSASVLVVVPGVACVATFVAALVLAGLMQIAAQTEPGLRRAGSVSMVRWLVVTFAVLSILGAVLLAPADENAPVPPGMTYLLVASGLLVVLAIAISLPARPPGVPAWSVRTLVGPRRLSQFLFMARDDVGAEDATIYRLSMYRSLAGLAAGLVVVTLTAPGDGEAAVVTSLGPLAQLFEVLLVLPLLTAVTAVILVATAPSGQRKRGLRSLGICVMLGALTLALVVVLDAYSRAVTEPFGAWLLPHLDTGPTGTGPVTAEEARSLAASMPYLPLAALYAMHQLWLLLFEVWSVYYAVKSCFRLAELSPLTAPVLTVVSTWTVFALNAGLWKLVPPSLVLWGSAPLPATAQELVLNAVGGITVTALAVWETSRLRARGIGWHPVR